MTTTAKGVCLACGALLLVAGLLKGYEGVVTRVPWVLGLALAEITLAIWLLVGNVRREVLVALSLMFAAFAGVNAAKVWAGETTCGCFGPADVNPRVTLAIDLVLTTALFAVVRSHRVVNWRLMATALGTACVGASATTAVANAAPMECDDHIVLDPDDHAPVGLGVSELLNDPAALRGVRALVVLDSRCGKCVTLLDTLEDHPSVGLVFVDQYEGSASPVGNAFRPRACVTWGGPVPSLLIPAGERLVKVAVEPDAGAVLDFLVAERITW